MTLWQLLVADCSTVANFKSWGQAVSNFILAAGWVKTADTGQVDWATIASVPASGNYVYEIWRPGDALTSFILKMEYGYSNAPHLAVSMGLTTNGAGILVGTFTPRIRVAESPASAPSASTLYSCWFAGDNNRLGLAMWKDVGSAQFFGIERSVDSSGAYTSSYVTFWTCGNVGFGSTNCQRTISLTGGGTMPGTTASGSTDGWGVRSWNAGFNMAYANSIMMDTCAPMVGYWDYPCTIVGLMNPNDVADSVTFETIIYGTKRTYLPLKGFLFGNVAASCCLVIRCE